MTKEGGNNGAGRGHNNQPSTGAANACGGWQQEQEDNGWQLVTKEDGCCPVMKCRDDGAPSAGRRGTQRQWLFCHCCHQGADIATRGRQEVSAKREQEGQEDNNDAALATNGGQGARQEATTKQRTRGVQ